eukprot:UC4_evm2s1019
MDVPLPARRPTSTFKNGVRPLTAGPSRKEMRENTLNTIKHDDSETFHNVVQEKRKCSTGSHVDDNGEQGLYEIPSVAQAKTAQSIPSNTNDLVVYDDLGMPELPSGMTESDGDMAHRSPECSTGSHVDDNGEQGLYEIPSVAQAKTAQSIPSNTNDLVVYDDLGMPELPSGMTESDGDMAHRSPECSTGSHVDDNGEQGLYETPNLTLEKENKEILSGTLEDHENVAHRSPECSTGSLVYDDEQGLYETPNLALGKVNEKLSSNTTEIYEIIDEAGEQIYEDVECRSVVGCKPMVTGDINNNFESMPAFHELNEESGDIYEVMDPTEVNTPLVSQPRLSTKISVSQLDIDSEVEERLRTKDQRGKLKKNKKREEKDKTPKRKRRLKGKGADVITGFEEGAPSMFDARASVEYKAKRDTELDLKVNETVQVLSTSRGLPGTWVARNAEGIIGFIPTNAVGMNVEAVRKTLLDGAPGILGQLRKNLPKNSRPTTMFETSEENYFRIDVGTQDDTILSSGLRPPSLSEAPPRPSSAGKPKISDIKGSRPTLPMRSEGSNRWESIYEEPPPMPARTAVKPPLLPPRPGSLRGNLSSVEPSNHIMAHNDNKILPKKAPIERSNENLMELPSPPPLPDRKPPPPVPERKLHSLSGKRPPPCVSKPQAVSHEQSSHANIEHEVFETGRSNGTQELYEESIMFNAPEIYECGNIVRRVPELMNKTCVSGPPPPVPNRAVKPSYAEEIYETNDS